MAFKYTEEKLNSLDKETIIHLFLSQQEQLGNTDHNLQLALEQMADLKRHRFGRSSERHETENQISFMEMDEKIVFFNEAKEETGKTGRRPFGPSGRYGGAFHDTGGTGSPVRGRGL